MTPPQECQMLDPDLLNRCLHEAPGTCPGAFGCRLRAVFPPQLVHTLGSRRRKSNSGRLRERMFVAGLMRGCSLWCSCCEGPVRTSWRGLGPSIAPDR